MSATDWNELDGYEALVSELRANPPVAPERLRQQVLAGAPGSRGRMSKRRRLAFVVVPVAVALAVGAALVHGLVSSNSNLQNRGDAAGLSAGLSYGTVTTPSAAHRSVDKATKKEFAPLPKGAQALTTLTGQPHLPQSGTVVIPKNRLVHADATLQVQVQNHSALSQATNNATKIVSSLGGYAQSVQYQSAHNGSGSAYLALRVPVGKAQTAIARLGQLGRLISQQISTQDLQQQLTRQTNSIG